MPAHHQHFAELSECSKYVVQSSDVIEDLRVYVREENSERVLWYKERFLTDDEIVENLVENATSRICWTIHRPKRGWYIRISAPSFPVGASIPLTPVPTSSPFHAEGALSFSSRTNPPKRKSPSPAAAAAAASQSASRSSESTKSSMETITSSSETVVHSYPPTPSGNAASASAQPPSPATVRAKLDQLSTAQQSPAPAASVVKQFLLAPHSSSHVPVPENTSLLVKALSMFKNNQPSHSLSFTLCPLPESLASPSSSGAQQPPSTHAKRHSLARLGEMIPPSPSPLVTFHDRTPVWNFGSTTGLLEIDVAMEREFGIDRSFWVTVSLAYMEFLTERESYLAAAGG
ncbi:hypothetical protein M0805_004526 [Coniferiporia weirii]|nr:hypothetical protein M0805_004526 [Coniferiporia weirii]